MAGFQRFISYLYKYENDDRQENIGFAKVEIRGSSYRLEVHVRNMNMEKPDCTVYLFTRKEEIMQGVPIGEMYIRRGNGDVRYTFEEKDLSEFGVAMNEIEGIFISVSEGLYIASQWKEGEIKEKNLQALKKGEVQVMPEQPQEEKASGTEKEQENHRGEPEEGQNQTAGADNREARQTESGQSQPAREISHMGGRQRQSGSRQRQQSRGQQVLTEENAVSQENMQKPQGEETTAEEQKGENLKATEIPMEKFLEDGDLEEAFQKLRLKLTVFYPFQGEDIECVKVDITDLQELPKKYWYLGKNSFLLHGFFNYRHLIMGEIKKEEKSEYFIGVPGVFQNQERIMAAMFGFPEFRTAEQSEYKTGNFGYWYRVV